MPDDIEYRGLMAEAWDALRGDTSDWEDRAWFREVVRRNGEPALDVGCGTGRLLLDFLADGVDVDGVDNAPDMLALLQAKASAAGLDVDGRVHLGRMESLRMPRRYRTVMVPSSSFQLLVEPDEAAEAVRRFFAHLEPGGVLAMPFIVMDTAYAERWSKEATLADGSLVRRTAVATFDPADGVEATDDRYEVFRDGALVRSERFVRPRATRAWSREEARLAYERAGFRDLEWGADFTFQDRPPESVFTIVGRRPG
ncbi:MAG: class I SAM-dependent methyltransferase [Chloroflexota bacterium]